MMAVDPFTLDFGRTKRFCVYVYFDPRPRKRRAPIWVGKGLTNTRPDTHWKQGSHNPFLNSILAKIRAKGLEPIIEFAGFFDDEKQAFACEVALIKKFGMRSRRNGTLCNLTAGGEGITGHVGHSRPSVLNRASKAAAKLRLARIRLGLSQTALAEKLGVGLRSYQEWENGDREIRAVAAFAIEYLIEHRDILIPGKRA